MAKAPADQFYFGDYIRDTRSLSLEARGAWMDILSHGFFKSPQGRIRQDLDTWARMFGCSIDTAKTVLEAIKKHEVGDVVTERNGDITVTNRRQYNNWQEKEANRIRQKKYREGQSNPDEAGVSRKNNGKITPYSSSSSSSSDLNDQDLKIETNISIINLYQGYTKRFNEHEGTTWNGKWNAKDDKIGKRFNSIDITIVELGIIRTQVNKGIGNGRIQSFQYYANEIQITAEESSPMKGETLQMMLKRHREKLDQWFGKTLDGQLVEPA